MTAAARSHASGPRALLTVFGLGTVAVAGAAIALAVSGPPHPQARDRHSARRRSAAILDASYGQDADGSGLFV